MSSYSVCLRDGDTFESTVIEGESKLDAWFRFCMERAMLIDMVEVKQQKGESNGASAEDSGHSDAQGLRDRQ